MTSCASFSINNPQNHPYDDTLRNDALSLSVGIGGPVLAIDTAGAVASVALVHGAKRRVVELANDARSLPCESLAQSIADILGDANLKIGELAALVAGVGPGSFTGLRVGLATLQGFALATGVPMYGVSSLAVLAAGAGPGPVACVCDARRGDVYAAMYQVDASGVAQALVPDNVFTREAWAQHLETKAPVGTRLVGDLAAAFAESVPYAACEAPRRALLAVIQAATAIRAGQATPVKALLPRYLRLSEAERQLASVAYREM